MVSRWRLLAGSLSLYQNLVSLFQDTLFPVYCFICNNEGAYLCDSCCLTAPSQVLQTCPFCGLPTAYGMTCDKDRRKTHLDGLTSGGNYHDWIWRDVVKAWKFGGARDLDKFLKKHLLLFLPQLPHGLYSPIIIPVPLTKRRQRARGFNQSVVLAEALAEVFETEVGEAVVKIRDTKQQSGLTRGARLQNLRNAFSVDNTKTVKDKDCIIVDDLLTTGATMNEISRVLKDAGAKKVWGVSLLRAQLKTR